MNLCFLINSECCERLFSFQRIFSINVSSWIFAPRTLSFFPMFLWLFPRTCDFCVVSRFFFSRFSMMICVNSPRSVKSLNRPEFSGDTLLRGYHNSQVDALFFGRMKILVSNISTFMRFDREVLWTCHYFLPRILLHVPLQLSCEWNPGPNL